MRMEEGSGAAPGGFPKHQITNSKKDDHYGKHDDKKNGHDHGKYENPPDGTYRLPRYSWVVEVLMSFPSLSSESTWLTHQGDVAVERAETT